jgi:hypothetical protein
VPEAIDADEFDIHTQMFIKHILVLKIWNKTLQTIGKGLTAVVPSTQETLIKEPGDFAELIRFFEEKLGRMAVLTDTRPTAVFQQCLAMSTARENSAVAVWHNRERRSCQRLLTEADLHEFFTVLNQAFPDLRQTRFYVLVDDLSEGSVHFETQKVLNSLVRGAQASHCFKITCDKFMHTLDTADGRAIDPRHEVTYVDLGEISVRSQRATPIDLSAHMEEVVNLRLKAAGYRSTIAQILGKSQRPKDFLSALSLPGARRAPGEGIGGQKPPRAHARYAGWNIVWSISHGSVRTLLELVEFIFMAINASEDTVEIPLSEQDAAVRSYATRQFRALQMLPVKADDQPLGPRLQSILGAIGQISRAYLSEYDTGDPCRWYETISFERLDDRALCKDAADTLLYLVKYGLLLDEGVTFSRAQFGLCRRYDMNKIFAPALRTTYRVRNHMYLSQANLEQLLLHPEAFVRRHRRKLAELVERRRTLFDGKTDIER